MIYFAYGSNLSLKSFLETCPMAQSLGAARLVDHKICFPRRSLKRQCAVASIAPHEGGEVWGAIYRLDASDWQALDLREGYEADRPIEENDYIRDVKTVKPTQMQSVEALTYIALPQEDPGLPSAHYLGLMISGAKKNEFPMGYVAMLEGIKTEFIP